MGGFEHVLAVQGYLWGLDRVKMPVWKIHIFYLQCKDIWNTHSTYWIMHQPVRAPRSHLRSPPVSSWCHAGWVTWEEGVTEQRRAPSWTSPCHSVLLPESMNGCRVSVKSLVVYETTYTCCIRDAVMSLGSTPLFLYRLTVSSKKRLSANSKTSP